MPATKIVITLGPATDRMPLTRLLEAGVDVFRLNASHGGWDDHHRRIAQVREASQKAGVQGAVLLDLQGPKIRLGRFADGGCTLETGSIFTISTVECLGTCDKASTNYKRFAKEVLKGSRVLLADGSIELQALESDGHEVRCRVLNGGPISNHKGINLPGVALSIPSLAEKDREDLAQGVQAGVDFVALSFVRTAADLVLLYRHMEELDASIPVIAKIEKPEGWKNLDSILDAASGVMVARGDLGVEMALEKVPFIQKRIIEQARERGKFVITATQMLESMIEHPYPTRAEVSDVANAICDGTDAVMLSAETSVGVDPLQAVLMMARIARETETWRRPQGFLDTLPLRNASNVEIIADAAYHAAKAASVAAIVVFTASGATARRISRYRPPVPIYAFTPRLNVVRQLRLSYGVEPVLAEDVGSTEEMLVQMEQMLVDAGKLKPEDNVVFVAGHPIGEVGSANLIKLHRVRNA